MQGTVVVIGGSSSADCAHLEKCAAFHHLTIEYKEQIDKPFESLPSGFISFLPCTLQNIISLFGVLPVGAGEKIPFFQMIDQSEIPEFLYNLPVMGVFESPVSMASSYSIMQAICRTISNTIQHDRLTNEIISNRRQKQQLVQIGTSLSKENDLNQLLEIILTVCRQIVSADAGSIYVRERRSPGGPFIDMLQFRVSQNDSIVMKEMSTYTLPMNDGSIAGFVAKSGRTVAIDDVSKLDAEYPYRSVGKDFEKKFGYRIKSMLTLPLKNIEGEVVGVLQLINKKKTADCKLLSSELVDENVIGFPLSDQDFVQAVASQAAVSIERAQLHENIRVLFEGFLNSSIAAIDERDKVTSGHSKRVMGYAMAFIDAAALDPESPFSELSRSPDRMRQFQFAALLHDIGKIGVPEHLLTKECRLPDGELNAILTRLDAAAMQMKYEPDKVSWKSIVEINEDKQFLEKVNKAGNLSNDDLEKLKSIRDKTYMSCDEKHVNCLSEKEYENLSIQYGNLTIQERRIINSHAQSTYRILSKISWPRSMELIPVIASQHHEKLDGSGYPEGIKSDGILMESKILAVIDIYEALVSQDRPYKPKMPPQKALMILQEEAAKGHLDQSVVSFFIEKELYKLYTEN